MLNEGGWTKAPPARRFEIQDDMSDLAAHPEAEPIGHGDEDVACWQEAIRIHNSNQRKGPSSKRYIHLHAANNGHHGPKKHARDLMVAAVRSYQATEKKRGPFAVMLIRIYNNVQQYSRAIDVFVQSDPTVASLIWGSIRVLLQMGEEQERASRIATEGIIEIVRHAGIWEQVSAVSGLLSSNRIRPAVTALYVAVLDFLLSSTKWLERGTLGRLGVSIFKSKADKFQQKLDALRSTAKLVDKELQTQVAYKGLGTISEITSNVHLVMNKIDKILEQVQHLSDYAFQLHLESNSELLALTRESSQSVKNLISELELLPLSITNAVIAQMEGTQDIARIRQWLVLSVVEKSPPVSCADGTCSWILQHPSFLEWDGSQNSCALWVQGHQGCGKSVLAGYIQEVLTARNRNTLSYRFQRSASDTQSTPTSFASSLLYQLLERSTEMSLESRYAANQKLQSLVTQFPLGPQHCTFKTMWGVVVSMLSDISRSFHQTIVIDGMDECSFDGSSLPGAFLFTNTLFETIQDTQTKLVIFTRPDPAFRTAVQHPLSISMFLSSDLLLPDIMTFARREYQQLELPASEMDEATSVIQTSAQGSFRWTELFLHHLGQSLQITNLRERMRNPLPPSISELYRQSMVSAVERLTPAELECRNALLLAIFQAQRPLKTTEIADALSILPGRAETIISRLCQPLASTYGGFFHLSHPSVREFFDVLHHKDDDTLGILFSESDELLAERCLSCLLGEKYSNLDHIASLLMANYDDSASVSINSGPPDGSFYDYASRFWDHHLVRVKKPRKKLIQLVNKFFSSIQFAYWSEKSVQESVNVGQLIRVNVAVTSLTAWHKTLCREAQVLVELDKYYEDTYRRLAGTFESRDVELSNKVLSSVARMAVGDFYFTTGNPEKLASTRQQVALELGVLLGPQHALTLRAKSDFAFVRLSAGKVRAAHRMYSDAANKQQEVLGEQSVRFLETLAYKGQTQFFMTDVVAAVMTWAKTSAEILGLEGPDSWLYLAMQWWYAQGVTYLGQPELGLHITESIVKKRRELFGPTDSFAYVIEVTVGEIQFLLGRHEEAITTVHNALIWGRAIYPPSHLWRLDTEITLAMMYHAAGKNCEALAIVGEVEPAVTRIDFPRYCQLIHLTGLLLLAENPNEAIRLLQSTLTESEQDQENRALLWIRLDLAAMLRKRGAPGDAEQALVNFDNLVHDVSGEEEPGFPDEPDPPRLCEAAERALRLIRERKHAEAKKVLDENGLDWKRPSDLWLWTGGSFCKDFLRVSDRDLDRWVERGRTEAVNNAVERPGTQDIWAAAKTLWRIKETVVGRLAGFGTTSSG